MDRSRVSRNDPCPCGSGKKYKHCCLPKEVAARQTRPSPALTDPHGKPKKRPEYPIGTVALHVGEDARTGGSKEAPSEQVRLSRQRLCRCS
jgi:hypothetical protein